MASPHVSRLAVWLVLALILAPPLAEAHLLGARPLLQRFQRERLVGLDPGALGVHADLSLTGDPLRQFVMHDIDPPRGEFRVEYREDASKPEEGFHGKWRFERLLEYRDANLNGRFESQLDTPLRVWRFQHYQWNRSEVRNVAVSDVQGNSIVWEGDLTGAPHVRMEVVIAGKDFTDEGAIVRPQDVAIYFDLTQMPPRGVGSLYALEISVEAQEASSLALHKVDNTSTALMVDAPGRRAFLLWGGEAVLDGVEQRLDATLEGERVTDQGERVARLVIHVSTVDESMRFVMVSGVEYLSENLRTPAPGAALALLGLVAVAWGARRRR